MGFEQAKKKCFMSVDKSYLATIFDISSQKEMFEALDKKNFATNTARLRQLLRDCQAISTQRNIKVMEKYEAMLNPNAEIYIQKLELALQDKNLINFFMTSIPSTYEEIIDNLNMCDILTLDGTVCVHRIKET